MYIVYCTINKLNQKPYIGVHYTDNLLDGYMGSGKALKYAIKKYGKQNFISFVLGIFEDKEEAYEYEAFYVSEEFVNTNKTYNKKEGGLGTPVWTDEMKLAARQRALGNTHKRGKKQTPWNKGKAHCPTMCRPILDTQTGIFWTNYKEAAEVLGMKPRTLMAQLGGEYKNKTNLIKA